jgi:hypothetical protein
MVATQRLCSLLPHKKTARWSVQPVKADKSYSYVPRLLMVIICMRLQDNEGMNQRVQMEVVFNMCCYCSRHLKIQNGHQQRSKFALKPYGKTTFSSSS